MQWHSDLPADWDEAPEDPPDVPGPELEIVDVNGGHVARPAEAPETGCIGTHSLFSTLEVDLGDGEPGRPPQ